MAHSETHHEPNRRDVLYVATAAVGAVGAGAAVWPLIDQMNPDAATRALATVEVDISAIEVGQQLTVLWQGKPVFIRRRTAEEIEAAKAVDMAELRDTHARNDNFKEDVTATDEHRAAHDAEEWLVMVGLCTHLGCVPTEQAGDFHGWYCPCHGSHYDTAGRIRKGPAPENLHIPRYAFVNATTLRIG